MGLSLARLEQFTRKARYVSSFHHVRTKELSATDVGQASTNQSGVLIPKAWARDTAILPALDTSASVSEEQINIVSEGDGKTYSVRYAYYRSKDEYRLTQANPLFRSLGAALAGDEFALGLDSEGNRFAALRKQRRAWLLLAAGEDRVYGGNEGYTDDPDSTYEWDSTVANSAEIQVGDQIALWDKRRLLGFSVIEEITLRPGTKVLRRCPECGKSRIKERKNSLPLFRCQECSAQFDRPESTTRDVTRYSSRHDAAWVNAVGGLGAGKLRSMCVSPGSQHSIRELRWDLFAAALSGLGFGRGLALVQERTESVPGGHVVTQTRVRVGQGRFRSMILRRYGNVCAFTGSGPEAALDAAHLYSYAALGVHLEGGGLMLRKDIHRLFDRGDLAVDPLSRTVDLRADIRTFPSYEGLHGAQLQVELDPKQWKWVGDHWAQHRS